MQESSQNFTISLKNQLEVLVKVKELIVAGDSKAIPLLFNNCNVITPDDDLLPTK